MTKLTLSPNGKMLVPVVPMSVKVVRFIIQFVAVIAFAVVIVKYVAPILHATF
jgi:hypothetical protein